MFRRAIGSLVLKRLIGKRISQPMWERLYEISLAGMNIGGGGEVSDSGELWVIDYVCSSLPSDRPVIVFDVGANVGNYAQQIATRFGGRAKVYCFEPSKKTFELLSSNTRDYANVQLFNFGLGDQEGSITLYSDSTGSGLASIYQRRLDHFGIRMEQAEIVAIRTLDGFCLNRGIDKIDLLKLDVEGHELKVLLGAKRLIDSRSIDFIQFEFGGCNIDSRTYFQDFFYLLNPNYKIYRILRDGLALVGRYKEAYEAFITTNYLAVSRTR